MSNRRRNAMIGLFVLAGLGCLGILIVKFGEASWLLRQSYHVSAGFERIMGVREGTQVLLAGVPVGRVSAITLADWKSPDGRVIVVMDIRKEYQIPKGATAIVDTPLMGQAVINISASSAALGMLPTDGSGLVSGTMRNPLESVVSPEFMATFEKTTQQIGDLAGALKPAAESLTELIRPRPTEMVDQQTEVMANISTAVARLDAVLKSFLEVLGDPKVQSNLKVTLENLAAASTDIRAAATGLNTFTEEARATNESAQAVLTKLDATVDTTHQHVDVLGQKLIVNADQLSQLLDHLTSAANDLAHGEGTAGMLLRDPKLHQELVLTLQRLGLAAQELTVLVKQWQKRGLF